MRINEILEALVHRGRVDSADPLWMIRDRNRKLRYRRDHIILSGVRPRIESQPRRGYAKNIRGGSTAYHWAYLEGSLIQQLPKVTSAEKPLRWDSGKFVYADTGKPFVYADYVEFTPDKRVIAYDSDSALPVTGTIVGVQVQ